MAEANLSVSITGDASGLISSLQNAQTAVGRLSESAGRLMGEYDGKEAKISITAIDNTAAGIASARSNIDSLKDKTVTISVRYALSALPKLAGGTKNARDGLAVVNDEKTSDPRELIEHNGRLFMFGGRDVLVPLGRGDKVYTASETKDIMASMQIPHYASGKNNELYTAAKAELTHYKKTNNVSASEELAAWNSMLERFAYDSEAVAQIQEEIFAAQQRITKAQKQANETALRDYKKHSDAWIKYQTQTADMSVQEQIDAYKRQLENYNAMVSQMAASTLYTADEMKEIWNDFYEYKADVDLKTAKLEQERNYSVYKKWQSDAANWKKLRDTYDDWEENGDSPVKFYERSIARIEEMYKNKNVGWQEYSDDTMEAQLNLYKAKMEQADELLSAQKKYISDLRQRFSAEEKALSESWEVEDRRESISETSRLLAVYQGAVTGRGMDKYKSLQEQMKKLRREEEMYALEKTHTETLTKLEKTYEIVEENKKYLLGVIERSGLNIEGIVMSTRYDIEDMQQSIESLFKKTISAIEEIRIVQNSYSDNREYNISSGGGASSAGFGNLVIGSIAHGNFY